jgi:hypothetical protein
VEGGIRHHDLFRKLFWFPFGCGGLESVFAGKNSSESSGSQDRQTESAKDIGCTTRICHELRECAIR